MECIVLIRMQNGAVVALMDGDYVAVFPDMDDAIKICDNHFLTQSLPYQIVELDEL